MKVVIAMDSFKGSLSTFAAGAAVAEGIKKGYQDAIVKVCPLADGGEGTVAAIVSATHGKLCTIEVTGPLGNPVTAQYGVISESRTAIIEMAAAAGITLINSDNRNPLLATTYGIGEIIVHAIKEMHCRNFIIGIGGSATNDGGIGMLQAMGFGILDHNGKQVPLGAQGLSMLAQIKTDKALPELRDCEFHIACDVKNVLCGNNGCSVVYGPQKGASPEAIADMDQWMSHYAKLTEQVTGQANENYPGAGAAGGMGFAFLSYLGGKLEPGIDLVMRMTGLEAHIKDCDIVVTGEGRLDGQSCMGKAPVGIAKVAKKYGKTVIAFSGAVTKEAHLCNAQGIDAFFPIVRTPCTLAEAMDLDNAYRNLKNTAEQVFRLVKCR